MARTKLYTAIFVVLMVFSTTQALVEMTGLLEEAYWVAFGLIIALSTIKAVFVALALTTAAAYSIL